MRNKTVLLVLFFIIFFVSCGTVNVISEAFVGKREPLTNQELLVLATKPNVDVKNDFSLKEKESKTLVAKDNKTQEQSNVEKKEIASDITDVADRIEILLPKEAEKEIIATNDALVVKDYIEKQEENIDDKGKSDKENILSGEPLAPEYIEKISSMDKLRDIEIDKANISKLEQNDKKDSVFSDLGTFLNKIKGKKTEKNDELQADITLVGDLDDIELEINAIPPELYAKTQSNGNCNCTNALPCGDFSKKINDFSTLASNIETDISKLGKLSSSLSFLNKRVESLEKEVGIIIPEFHRHRVQVAFNALFGTGDVKSSLSSISLSYSYASNDSRFSLIFRPEIRIGFNSFLYDNYKQRATVFHFDIFCASFGIRHNFNKDVSIDLLPVSFSFGFWGSSEYDSNDISFSSLLEFRYKNLIFASGFTYYIQSNYYLDGNNYSSFDRYNIPIYMGYSFII